MSDEFDRLAASLAEDVAGSITAAEGELAYVLLDVFTETPLEGNQLAVFADGRGLDPARMQRLAREMNLSETVFVLPPEQGGDARIRIFTPLSELPFAGHPTLGSAFAVGTALGLTEVRLETGVGIVPVELERDGGRVVFGRMQQAIPEWAPYGEREAELLAALGVERSGLPVEAYENGPLHVYVELESEETVAALRPDMAALAGITPPIGANCFAGSGTRWKSTHVRPRRWRSRGPGHRLRRRPAGDPPLPPRSRAVRRGDRDSPGRGGRQAVGPARPRRGKRRARRAGRGRGRGADRRRRPLRGLSGAQRGAAPPTSPPAYSAASARVARAARRMSAPETTAGSSTTKAVLAIAWFCHEEALPG